MKIRQPRIGVTVPVEIQESRMGLPCVEVSVSGIYAGCVGPKYESGEDFLHQEIVDAVRAAVDWNES